MVVTEWGDNLFLLFERGGLVLWAILAVSMLMWALILERYSYYFWIMPRYRDQMLLQWRSSTGVALSSRQRMKDSLVSTFSSGMRRYLVPIHTLADILPLLGLLGTISGMIKVFEVITLFGAGNARGMASGISEALITTMAGLVTAISGLYFCVNLESLTKREAEHFEVSLNRNDPINGDLK